MNFYQKLKSAVASWMPTKVSTVMDTRAQPQNVLPYLTVDRMAQILEGAQAGNTRDLFGLYRDIVLADNHLQGELGKRMLGVFGDPWSIHPKDKENPADVEAADVIRRELSKLPGLLDAWIHIGKAAIWPVALLEKVYRVAPAGSGLRYTWASLTPVEDTLLNYSTGKMRLEYVDPVTRLPNGQFDEEIDPERYLVHRGHMLGMPDNFGGPMRSLLYWFLLGANDREWWARFLDRFGSPFLVGKFDRNDDGTRRVLERAFSMASKLAGLVVNREAQVELHQAATAGTGEAFARFLEVCQKEKSRLILGQTLSATADATGMGSGTADLQAEVRQDLRAWDMLRLGSTLQEQLFAPFLRINGLTGATPTISWGTGKGDAALLGTLLVALENAGLHLSDKSLSDLSTHLGYEIERKPAVVPSIPGLTALAASGLAGDWTDQAVSTFVSDLGKLTTPLQRAVLDAPDPPAALAALSVANPSVLADTLARASRLAALERLG